jgi:serine protease Do
MNKLINATFYAVMISFMGFIDSAELPNFSDLAEKSSPAVVNITSTKSENPRSNSPYDNREFGDPRYDEFFKRFFGEDPRNARKQRPVISTGSGFIISDDGYLLTNNHVVDGADEIKVSMGDRREFIAEVIGADPRSDVALLKIDGNNLPTLEIGSSDKLKVGEWVVAIGSPFQLSLSVTAGIVSAKGRSIPNGSDTTYVPFLQTDVAINPGNSGGPLFNLEGQVIGINSQIYTRSGGYMGVSFAIPIDYAMDVADQLKEKGYVARGWLGVSIQEITSELAEALEMDVPKGALISQIIEESPAEESGLQEQDVILYFDGEEIFYSADLPKTVGAIKPGSKVNAVVLRDGVKKTLRIEVGELPTNPELISSKPSSINILGIIVANQDLPQDSESRIVEGVIVQEIDPDGLAARAGVLKNDIIYSLGRSRFKNTNEFNKALDDLNKERNTTIGVARQGSKRILSLKLTK